MTCVRNLERPGGWYMIYVREPRRASLLGIRGRKHACMHCAACEHACWRKACLGLGG